jgi:hypothetical protein
MGLHGRVASYSLGVGGNRVHALGERQASGRTGFKVSAAAAVPSSTRRAVSPSSGSRKSSSSCISTKPCNPSELPRMDHFPMGRSP